jgi:hypothetical protein
MRKDFINEIKKYHFFLQKKRTNKEKLMIRTPILGKYYNKYRILILAQNPKGNKNIYIKKDNYALNPIKNYEEYINNWKNNSKTNTQNIILGFIAKIINKSCENVYDYILFSNMIKEPTPSKTNSKDLRIIFEKYSYNNKNLIEYEIETFKPNIIFIFGKGLFNEIEKCSLFNNSKYKWKEKDWDNNPEGEYIINPKIKIPIFGFKHPSYNNFQKQLNKLNENKIILRIKKKLENKIK